MNGNNLDELINRYENQFAFVNNSKNDEIFKWKAVQQFHSVWFSGKSYPSFAELFKEAKKECSVLIDNPQVAPVYVC